MTAIKEKILGVSGSLTGTLSFLGNYSVCHNVCMALAAFLTFLGFSVAGMPLLFLTRVAIPFWVAAVSLLIIMLALNYKKIVHLSSKMLLFNSGLIIAGIPFQLVQLFDYIFWIIGGVLVILSAWWFIYDKIKKK